MLQVKIELVSAITGLTSEIGRMYITNNGDGSVARGNYNVAVCRKGTIDIPEVCGGIVTAARAGKVTDYPRLAYNVWRLIARATLAAFPEEVRAKNTGVHTSVTPEVMQGAARVCLQWMNDRKAEGTTAPPDDMIVAFYEWLTAAVA